ncbi:MAG: virulence factor SrfC family protein [Roseibium sp.]
MATSDDTRGSELNSVCESVLDSIEQSLDWADPAAMPAPELQNFARELRQSRREFRRLKRAATRPMCVAVFGPSQVGKSYLINSLSRRKGKAISVRFGDQEFDFLKDLNPEGNQSEATGLVSRFTTKPTQAPVNFPVEVRLHSLADVIKIIANTYFLDFNVAVEAAALATEEDIQTELEIARKSRGVGGGKLNEDDVLDIKEYIEERFHGRRTEEMLRTSGYWDDFAAIAGDLGKAEEERLVEMIWGRNPRLTELYRLIRTALEKSEFSSVAHCEIDALKPRERSILNIDSLDELGKSQADTVQIKLPNGRVTIIARAELTAIISELVLTLSEKPADYFDHADLLDFPGYRPRFEIQPDKMQEYLEQPDAFRELFRRGKVDYLFDSYRREQEISALLLCLAKGNQDVHAIPPLVDRWVKETHGATPDARKGKDTALFVVKTKFDTYFPESEGADASSGEAWKKAMGSEHVEFLGRAGDWPTQWTPGEPFKNLFWVRNPAMLNKNFMNYGDGTLKELGFENPEMIDQVRAAYLNEPLIQKHIAEPAVAFDAAAKPDDGGGVKYLTEKLAPVCNPQLKSQQVETRIEQSSERLLSRLKEHYISDDREEERKKRSDAIEETLSLVINYAESERFCHLIDMLQIDRKVMRRILSRSREGEEESKNASSSQPTGPAAASSGAIRSLLGQGAIDEGHQRQNDRSISGARSAVKGWSREAFAKVEQPLHLPGHEPAPSVLRNLVQEIIYATERVQLDHQIAQRLRELTSDSFSAEEFMDIQSTISTEEINDFVWTLGYRKIAEDDRPKLGGEGGQPIFANRAVSPDDLVFDFDSEGHVNITVASWCAAYIDTVERNLSGPSGGPNDPARNKKLGEIISNITLATGSVA